MTTKKMKLLDSLGMKIQEGLDKGFVELLIMVSLAFLVNLPARAQSVYGSITGIVTDSQNLPIPGAAVTLTNLGTAEQKAAQTSDAGSYEFLDLLPGNYRIEVVKQGFSRVSKQPIVVEVQSAVRSDLELTIGQVSETVNVAAVAPLLQTEDASVGQVVEQRTVTEMPLNGRNVMNLVALVPGVVPQGSTGTNLTNQNLFSAGNFQVDGGAANQSASFLDGAPVNTNYGNLTALVPSQDSIGEFRVVTNNDTAEYGRFTGGVINFTTKSGTNQWHGTAYEFIRNKVLNSNTFFNNQGGVPRPAFTQNQFGGNAGGPIIKDKLFIFGSYEGFRLRQGVTYVETVPTAAERNGDFSGLTDGSGNPVTLYNPFTTCGQYGNAACATGQTVLRTPFPGNQIPQSLITPASQTLISEFGAPNTAGTNGVNNFIGDASAGGGNDQYTVRGDYTLSENQRLFGRYTRWNLTNLAQDPYKNGTCFDSGQCPEGFTTNQVVLGDTISFGPKKILDVHMSYLRFNYTRTSPTIGYSLSSLGWDPSLDTSLPYRALPNLSVSGYGLGGSISIIARNNIYSLTPSFTWILGKHTLKIGGEGRRLDFQSLQDSAPSGTYSFNSLATSSNPLINTDTGNSFASYLIGTGASGSLGVAALTDGRMYYQGYYVTDSYKPASKLTLDLGIRWELPGAWTEASGSIANFNPTLATSVGGVSAVGGLSLVNTPGSPGPYLTKFNWSLFAPRTGLTYGFTPSTVGRVGYGIFFIPADAYYFESPFNNPVNNNVNNWNATTNGQLSFNNLFTNPFPGGVVGAPGRNPAFQPFGQNVNAPLRNEGYGYTQQWNVGTQHQFSNNFSLDIAYVGSKGTHLPMQEGNLNAIPDKYLSLGAALQTQVTNPYYGKIAAGPLSGPTVSYGQLLRPYPQFENVLDMGAYYGNSIYNSLQVKAQKQLGAGGTILAAYTWAKSISDTDTGTWWLESALTPFAQDYNNLKAERSLSGFDDPQRFVLSYVADLPIGKNKMLLPNVSGFADKLVSGWGVNGVTSFQSGFPLFFSIVSSPLTQFGAGAEQFGIPILRPNLDYSCSRQVAGGAVAKLNRWFNTSCFSQPGPYQYGNENRADSQLRQGGIDNYDFALYKNTMIGERVAFQFRTEIFNVFNRVQFGPPGNYFGVPTFGVVSSQVNNPRLFQFSGRVSF